MPDGVDPLANWMQATRSDPMLDRVLSKAKRSKLSPRDDPMLPPSQLTNPSVPPRLARSLPPRPREIAYTTMFCGLGGGGLGHRGGIRGWGRYFAPWLFAVSAL